jgi:hypothetical protein
MKLIKKASKVNLIHLMTGIGFVLSGTMFEITHATDSQAATKLALPAILKNLYNLSKQKPDDANCKQRKALVDRYQSLAGDAKQPKLSQKEQDFFFTDCPASASKQSASGASKENIPEGPSANIRQSGKLSPTGTQESAAPKRPEGRAPEKRPRIAIGTGRGAVRPAQPEASGAGAPPSDLPPPLPETPETRTSSTKPLPQVPQKRMSTAAMTHAEPPSDLPPTLEKASEVPPSEKDKAKETPSHLGALGNNPMAALRKVPKEQISDRSGVSKGEPSVAQKATATENAEGQGGKSSLLDEIRKGKQLRHAEPTAKSTEPTAQPTQQGGLRSALNEALEKRRKYIKNEEPTSNDNDEDWND